MPHIPGELLLQAAFHPAQGVQPTLPAAPPYPALHEQQQVCCTQQADGVSSACTSEGRDDVRGTGEGDGSQPLQPEQQFSSVGLALFKEWCNQAIGYLWLSMVVSPSTYLCLWKSSQNLLTCDYLSGTPFSQLKWITCFFSILTFTAITFCTFLFLILQRERDGMEFRQGKWRYIICLHQSMSSHQLMSYIAWWRWYFWNKNL